MVKKTPMPESPLGDVSLTDAPENELELCLDILRQQFETNPSHTLPAFEALTAIVSHAWLHDEHPPTVTVPWWTAEILCEGFMRYRDSALTAAPITLGEAYGIEGGGQGKQPKIQESLRELRDIRIATGVAMREAEGQKIEAALQDAADASGLSLSHVRRIWENNRDHARSSWKNFTTLRTS